MVTGDYGSALEYVASDGLDCGGRLFRFEVLDRGDGVRRGDEESWGRVDEALVQDLAGGDGGCHIVAAEGLAKLVERKQREGRGVADAASFAAPSGQFSEHLFGWL